MINIFHCSIFLSSTLIGEYWKTHPDFFPKFQFSESERILYWKTHPIFIFRNFDFGVINKTVLLENSSMSDEFTSNTVYVMPKILKLTIESVF